MEIFEVLDSQVVWPLLVLGQNPEWQSQGLELIWLSQGNNIIETET